VKILILGGYGVVGYQTAKILLHRTNAEIVLAGRSMDKARTAGEELGRATDSARVSGMSLDAFDSEHVLAAFRTVDWVIVCMPLAGVGARLARAAIEAGVNYIDINANQEKQAFLQGAAGDIKHRGLIFVSEAGLGPGVPSLLVRYAHEQLGALDSVEIGSIYRDRLISRGSARDMLVELGQKPRIFASRSWRQARLTEDRIIDFGNPYGRQRCYPFELLELVRLPVEEFGLENLGSFAAGCNPVVDQLVLVWTVTGLYKTGLGLRLGTRIARWASRFTKPPFRTLIQAEAEARDGGRLRVQVGHEDAYVATAIPVAACVMQMLDDDLSSASGLFLMGHLLETERFLQDIQMMGMDVTVVLEPSIESAASPGTHTMAANAQPNESENRHEILG
jgi:hypothetical protein